MLREFFEALKDGLAICLFAITVLAFVALVIIGTY